MGLQKYSPNTCMYGIKAEESFTGVNLLDNKSCEYFSISKMLKQ